MGKCQTWIHFLLIPAILIFSLSARYAATSPEAEALLTEFMVFSVNSATGLRRTDNLGTIESLSKERRQRDKRSLTDAEVIAQSLSKVPSYEDSTTSITSSQAARSILKVGHARRRPIADISIDVEDEPSSTIDSIRADLQNVQYVLQHQVEASNREASFAAPFVGDAAPKETSNNVATTEDEDYIPQYGASLSKDHYRTDLPETANTVGVQAWEEAHSKHWAESDKASVKWDRDDEIGEIFDSVMHHLHEAESKLKNLSNEGDSAENAQSKSKISAMPIDTASLKPSVSLEGKFLHLAGVNSELPKTTIAEQSALAYNHTTEMSNSMRIPNLRNPTIPGMKLSLQHPVRFDPTYADHNVSSDKYLFIASSLRPHANHSKRPFVQPLDEDASERASQGGHWGNQKVLKGMEEHEDHSENDGSFKEKIKSLSRGGQESVLAEYHRIPIVDQLVRDNLDSVEFPFSRKENLPVIPSVQRPDQRSRLESDESHESLDLMFSNYYNTKKLSQRAKGSTGRSPSSLRIDLEDPEGEAGRFPSLKTDSEIVSETYDDEILSQSLPSALHNLNPIFKVESHAPAILQPPAPDISPLIKMYFNVSGDNLTELAAMTRWNKSNTNEIEFYPLTNTSSDVTCMDGSKPGYYLRKGIEGAAGKWIVHLHGGAWCYDFHSCQKRRNTILGSTKNWFKEDIHSFFHGVLSRNFSTNHHFFNWNTVVLSYCDGGLFSGTRRKPISGKGLKYYFRGHRILQAQLDRLKEVGLNDATDIILSGTSAGGLALVLQGDYIRSKLPRHAKVRALVDAGLFLDEESVTGKRIARKQMKALYKLHRPKLNEKCILNYPPKQRYLCLFPEYTIKYVKLPIFFVNSLYDHWQLSELQGVHCVYTEKCQREDKDRILKFRENMFGHLMKIVKQKNDSGVFANSCLAHGQVILDYTWSHVKIENRTIENSFNDWYNLSPYGQSHVRTDCRYPCNGSCPRILSQRCVTNFKGASEHIRRKRNSELC